MPRLVLSWEDLQLDVPGAPGLLVSLLSSRVGLFDKSLFARLPEQLLARVSSDLPPRPGPRIWSRSWVCLADYSIANTACTEKGWRAILMPGFKWAHGIAIWLFD